MNLRKHVVIPLFAASCAVLLTGCAMGPEEAERNAPTDTTSSTDQALVTTTKNCADIGQQTGTPQYRGSWFGLWGTYNRTGVDNACIPVSYGRALTLSECVQFCTGTCGRKGVFGLANIALPQFCGAGDWGQSLCLCSSQ